jgi:predicted nicotinamide N-methyase
VPDATLVVTPLELCPELKLYLISADNILRSFSQKEMGVIFDNPPYWTFCWASGHALAFHILRRRIRVKGRTVLDFGAGSGVVAIAASMAGAAKVFACDNDDDAVEAISANATLNDVRIQTCASIEEIAEPLDVVIAADVFYDRENSPYLEEFLHWAPEIFVAESYLPTIGVEPYQMMVETATTTVPDVEGNPELRRVRVYRAKGSQGRDAYPITGCINSM